MPPETDPHSRTAMARGLMPAWVSVRRGAFRWDLEQGLCEEWLDENGELPLASWIAKGLADVVKTGPHRAVYRLALPQGIFYLKHYRAADWQAVLQNLIRPSKADLEWRAAQKVAAVGLKTFETVAVGRRRRFGLVMDNFLISREIPGVEPLDQFVLQTFASLGAQDQQTARFETARQLGEMTARLHRAGLLHRDLHPGNVLIQKHAGHWQLYLIDLHALSQKPKLNLRQIAFNLSLLTNFFARLTSKSDRFRFLKAYSAVWGCDDFKSSWFDRETIGFIERICQAELVKADARGDEKWQRGNRRLIILEDQSNHCRGVAGLGEKLLRSFQADPENLFARPHLIAWHMEASSPRRAMIALPVDGNPIRAIAKTFPHEKLARNAWEMGHALVRRRLPAPRPLLFVETKPGGRDYFVVEELPNVVSLEKRLADFSADQESQRTRLIGEVARQLRRLHDYGFYQPDLRLKAILIREAPEQLELWFASLESVQKLPRGDASRVMESLARFWLSLPQEFHVRFSHGLRFLRAYLGARSSAEWKTYWRGIARLIPHLSQEAA